VDRVVGSPERLVFEGAPVLDPPLAQDKQSRRAVATDGGVLDSMAACPPLTIVEQSRLRELHVKEAARLASDAEKVRKAFVEEQAQRLASRTGMSSSRARQIIARQCNGTLLPAVALVFDDEDLAGTTVADVLADPDKFVDATLADPIEGVEYGASKAKIMRRADGTIWINSFAHGRTVYELRLDYSAAEAALKATPDAELAAAFVHLALTAEVDPAEIEKIRNLVHARIGIGKRALDAMLKQAGQKQAAAATAAARTLQFSERSDPRPFVPAPLPDAEWLPQIDTINQVLGQRPAIVPPLRNADRACTQCRTITVPSLSTLSLEDE
jgi:hypothetical protein